MHVGPIVSSDLFYNPDEGQYERWSKRGVLAVEMEAAALFTVGALRGVQAGCLLIVSDIVVEGEFKRITDDEMKAAVDRMTRVALATATVVSLATPSSSSTRRRRTGRPAGAGPRWRTAPRRGGSRATRSSPSARASSASLARDAADGGAKLLVVVGGDGSVNEVANGIAGRDDVEIAVIPRGTGWDFVAHVRDPAQARRRDRRRADGDVADDRPRPRELPRLGRRRGRVLLRQRRERGHERRDRPARERDDEGARRQGLVPLGDARRLRALAELGAPPDRRRRDPGRPDARRRRRERRVRSAAG